MYLAIGNILGTLLFTALVAMPWIPKWRRGFIKAFNDSKLFNLWEFAKDPNEKLLLSEKLELVGRYIGYVFCMWLIYLFCTIAWPLFIIMVAIFLFLGLKAVEKNSMDRAERKRRKRKLNL